MKQFSKEWHIAEAGSKIFRLLRDAENERERNVIGQTVLALLGTELPTLWELRNERCHDFLKGTQYDLDAERCYATCKGCDECEYDYS